MAVCQVAIPYLRVLCLFFLLFFLRLWVAIFLSFRFLPQGTGSLLKTQNLPMIMHGAALIVKCP
ncbi:MAG: hypothetical protein A2087_03610 [Spirochaetes bacterium GWD1_61_31]|nr:MAG: hypothetical protein A2Y37_00985 [Spirochaetes bacterium GWB1_60_80]OHD30420.1 MAG: hypothetical protein A2004_11400 [Spirochaetes bacterium GWC1_61_12]OHD36178.1 MAG: hypothetical protein A2087_03610 [Spirochaetes bacterium GWD1_61_31]OHD43242.1 MAG: hypothetical protein A2Y35_08430 [Spirochaetes bacterium GWE1_60_18]OHD58802.1 MAG: hypothetical protein A2Y32_01265 [Spirochaetes bacterium GWF1_60_12]